MARLSKIRIGMAVFDRTGAIVGVVKALELAEGVKPPPSLVLGETPEQDRRMLEKGTLEGLRTTKHASKGHLLIETSEGEDIVESLDSIDRVADTAVHLAVVRQINKASGGVTRGRVSQERVRPHPDVEGPHQR